MKQAKGPQVIRFFKFILEVLRETGGSGTAAEVIDRAVEKMKISEKEQQTTNKNGQSRVKNQVNWARLYLVHAGYLDSSKRGIWSLTEKGMSFDPQTFYIILGTFKQVQRHFRDEQKPTSQADAFEDEAVEPEVETRDHRVKLLNLIKLLAPAGFERLSQRLLRESGFQQFVVTGRSGDGGIDGMGVLQVNPFVSFKVLFQCKRYQGAVTPSQVRDFCGAMMGRADKGIIITTGTFTLDAKKRGKTGRCTPIELVDGESLVQMFERLELGLVPRTWNLSRVNVSGMCRSLKTPSVSIFSTVES